MKTAYQIFKDKPELQNHPEVKELITEYDRVCDELVDLQQVTDMGKEVFLKELVKQIRNSITAELQKDTDADRYGETDNVNFKQAVINLQEYMSDYLRDHQIYL